MRNINYFYSKYVFFFFKERRLSRGEISLTVPQLTNEHGQHNALGMTPSNQTLGDNDKSILKKTEINILFLFYI